MTYTALSSKDHLTLRRKRGTFFYLNDHPLVPVSAAEAPRAALDLPLVFTRNDQGGLHLMAMLAMEKGNNVHVGPKGLWMGGYMPAFVRAHPFSLAFQKDQAVIVFKEDSDWLSNTEGQPLFDASGNPTKLLDQLTELLKTAFPNPVKDTPVLKALDDAKIVEPWSAVSESLLRVNLEKLAGLGNKQFLSLRQNNALPVLYSQLMSMPRINRVKNLAKRKEKMSEKIQQTPDLIQDDDIISFD
jgi:hypothetical protein